MVMFDSLNRHLLPPYGCDSTIAPNFTRLAQRALTFDKSYICSMPCMPARRDLHTGRPNFLHRSWGPLEPFDDSVPEILKKNGVHTHLASDHQHYWEDGGCTYHTRYSSWEFFRGQEGDPWIGQVVPPTEPLHMNGKNHAQDWINRPYTAGDGKAPQAQTFAAGLEYIRRNRAADNWFLQIETFDPHEPFVSPQKYKELYPHEHSGPLFDWPAYRAVSESPAEVAHCRYEYLSLLSMCDEHLGKVLDAFDEYNLWDDTLLMVWTDHGFLLGEHDSWAKGWCPWYEELSHTPFFLHDPRSPAPGERRNALVQPSLDLGPTLLEYFGLERTPDMLGRSLLPVIQDDTPIREAALFGLFGMQVNVTDGRLVYMRGSNEENAPLFNYTLMPTSMRARFDVGILQQATLAPPLAFTKGCPVLRLPCEMPRSNRSTLLFDLQSDPDQQNPLHDPVLETHMLAHLSRLMAECAAPREQWQRLNLKTVT